MPDCGLDSRIGGYYSLYVAFIHKTFMQYTKLHRRTWLIAASIQSLYYSPALLAAPADPLRDYPARPIRFIVPFVPGAGTDITTRTVAKKLSETWGQQVVTDNRSGAAGAIGAEITARATPDGYTLCLISSGHTVLAAVNDRLPYDIEKDLTGLSQLTTLFYILTVHPSVPVKTVKELIAHAKANPGKLKQGSSGTGALQHFSGEMLAYLTGTKFTHIPYKGGGAAVAALVSGEVEMAFTTLLSTRSFINSGRLRYIAITAGKRSPAIPELPTISEAGVPGFEANQWYGAVTSSKVHPAIVRKLSNAMRDAVHAPEVVDRLAADGSTALSSTPDEFNAHIKTEIAKWRRLVNAAGLQMG
jgi:tripartite-type tricarboxylate transporter receptor subunit TctC